MKAARLRCNVRRLKTRAAPPKLYNPHALSDSRKHDSRLPSMLTIKGIDHVVIRVMNLDGAISFYRDVLGCSVERVREDLGLVHMRAGRTLIDLVSVAGKLGRMGGDAPAPRARNMDHLCLRIEPFDEETLRAHLSAKGL